MQDRRTFLSISGIYFSAHWCPPCRNFTPKLATFYENCKKMENILEIIFVSSDRDEEGFEEYFGEMPWLALPYDSKTKKVGTHKRSHNTVVIITARFRSLWECNVFSYVCLLTRGGGHLGTPLTHWKTGGWLFFFHPIQSIIRFYESPVYNFSMKTWVISV